ncbi:MAG TPA: hypothetical protein VFA95_15685 [Gammaproteobacteria bacterium]|nr:hypothetical protein [Gammaproteobacteria bacterium]
MMLQLPNGCELAMLYLAVARAGRVHSPLPVRWRRHELKHVARITGARFYIGGWTSGTEAGPNGCPLSPNSWFFGNSKLTRLMRLEEIPRNPVGKVLKKDLRRQARDEAGRTG